MNAQRLLLSRWFRAPILCCLFLAIGMGQMWGNTGTMTIGFMSNNSDGSTALTTETFTKQVSTGSDNIASVSATANCYPGVGGLKVSSKKNNGSFSLRLAKSLSITKVVLSVKNKTATQISVKVGDSEFLTSDSFTTEDFSDMSFTGEQTSDILSIAIGGKQNDQRVAYLASITISYTEEGNGNDNQGGASGTEPITVTISYTDIPDGFTAMTGTSGTFNKTVSTTNDLTVAYSGINTKSSATAKDHAYGYAMFLKNNGFIYSNSAIEGYYPSKVTVTFASNTGESGKAGISFGSSAITSRNSEVSGSVSKSGTCELSNTNEDNLYWNFSTTSANVQVDNIVVTYTPTSGSGEGVVKTLQSIAISGETTKKAYEVGESFDATALTVTATYKDEENNETTNDVTENVDWTFNPTSFTTAGTVSVTATASYTEGEVTKTASKTYNDITVTQHTITAGTYEITPNNTFFNATSANGSLTGDAQKTYTGKQNDVTIEYAKGSGSNMFMNDTQIRMYKDVLLTVSVPTGYNIKKIVFAAGKLKETAQTALGAMSDEGKTWTGSANSVAFTFDGDKGNVQLTSITVTYAAAVPTHELTYGVKTGQESMGSVSATVDGVAIASESQVEEGATVTLVPAPNAGYQVKSVEALTATVADDYTFTMPSDEEMVEVEFEAIPVTAITLNKTAVTLTAGETEMLTVTEVQPATAINTVTWESTATSVATVNNGVVTAVAAGEATIKAISTVTNTVFGSCVVIVNAATGYAVTLNQNAGGTISADKTINIAEGETVTLTAEPAKGYEFTEWTVLNGETADEIEVTDNQFEMPAANVEVEAKFTHVEATIFISVNGVESQLDGENTHYMADEMTLPATADAISGKTFIGWTNAEITTATDERPATIYTPNATYTIAKGKNIVYALYAEVEGGEASYNKVTSVPADWAGEYLIVYESGNVAFNGGLETLDAVSNTVNVTISENTIEANATTNAANFTIAAMENGYYVKSASGKYLCHTKNENGLTSATSATANNLSIDNDGNAVIGITYSDDTITLRYNKASNQTRFRYYKSGQEAVQLYKKNASAASYSQYTTRGLLKPEMPTFDVAAGTYTEQQIIVVETATTGATIYYTLDGTDPTDSDNTARNAYDEDNGIELTERGTYTILAATEKDGVYSDIATIEYTICLPVTNTIEKAYTPAEAIEIYNSDCYNNEEVYVKGVVTRISSTFDTQYGNYELYVKEAGTDGSVEFEFYRMYKTANQGKFTEDEIGVGDTLIAIGTITKYGSVYEFTQGCYMVERKAFVGEKASIANDQATAYTVAEAINFVDNSAEYDLSETVFVKGVVTSTETDKNNNFNIYVKDADANNSFEFYACTNGNNVKENDTIIGSGVLTKYNTKYEFATGCSVIEIKPYIAAPVAVTGIALDETEATLKIGNSITLTATISPDDATNTGVTWSSSNTAVATVDDGTVQAVAEGSATITVTTTDGSFTATCEVTVIETITANFTYGNWMLVTDVESLAQGDYIVMASNTQNKVAADLNNKVLDVADATFSEDKNSILTIGEEALYLRLDGSKNNWLLKSLEDKALGVTKVKELAWEKGTATWSITIEDNNATIQNNGENLGRFLHNTTTPRFTTYTSNTSTTMLLPQLYRFTPYSVTFDAGEGTFETEKLANQSGKVVIPASKPVREGYYFMGWTDAEDNMYKAGEEITVTGDMTLTATWEELATYTRDVTVQNFGTICLAYPVYEGCIENAKVYKLISFSSASADGLLLEQVFEMEAGKPYFFVAEAAQVRFNYSVAASAASAATLGGLIGVLETEDINNENYYVLQANEMRKVNQEVSIPANRAYLDITTVEAYGADEIGDAVAASRRRVIAVRHAQDSATGEEYVQGEQRVEKCLINGQIYIIHSTQEYNAVGGLKGNGSVYTIEGQIVKGTSKNSTFLD